jgi:methyl-accepting chemotaxis protein
MIPIVPNAKTIIYIVLAVCLCVVCYMFGPGLFGGRARVDQVRDNIQSAGDQQQQAAQRLDTIKTGLDTSAAESGRVSTGLGKIADTIAGTERRIDSSKDQSNDSASLIAEGKRIVEQIKQRNKTGN